MSAANPKESKHALARPNKPKSKSTSGKRFRTDSQIIAHRAHIAELLLKGIHLYRICEIIGIGYELLRKDIEAIHKSWSESTLWDYDKAKRDMLQQWMLLRSTYWDAWDRSRAAKIKDLKRKSVRGRGNKKQFRVVSQDVTTEEVHGDPRYLAGVERCNVQISLLQNLIETGGGKQTDAIAPVLGQHQATYFIMPAMMAPKEPPKNITPQLADPNQPK